MNQQPPEWALPLVAKIRNAIIEKPGDVNCTAVLQAVLDGLGDGDVPEAAMDFAGRICMPGDLLMIYRIITRSLAEELRSTT